MGPEDYGIYALVVTIAVFISMIFYGPLAQGFIRFYYHYFDQKLVISFSKLIYKILIISVLILFIICSITSVASSFIRTYHTGIFILLVGFYIITSKINEFFNSVLNLIRKRKENSILQGSEKAIIIIFLFVLIMSQNLALIQVFIILALVPLISSILKISIFQKILPKEDEIDNAAKKNLRTEMKSNLISYMTPFLLWGLSGWLQLNGEKWIINGVLSTRDVGIYSVMMALVNALIIVPNNIISDFSTPIIFKQYSNLSDRQQTHVGQQYIYINILIIISITIFSTLITYFYGKELIILISNSIYTPYWYLLPMLCFGVGLFLTGQALTLHGLALNVPRKYLIPKVLVGFVSVGLNLFLIEYFGINGVAYSMLIIGLLYVLGIASINKKLLPANNK